MVELLPAFDPAVLATFVLATLMLNLTPGADFLLVTATSVSGGPRAGVAAGVGVNLGITVHVAMAAAGVSALLAAHPAAYDVIRYAGAAYLVWIGVQTWKSAGEALGQGRAALTYGTAIRRGFLTNILNPKTALFIFAFIPQFTNPALGPIWQQILLLGAIFTVQGFLFVCVLASAAGALSRPLRTHARSFARLSSLVFGGLALRLAFDQ